jgi:hypothetical protein
VIDTTTMKNVAKPLRALVIIVSATIFVGLVAFATFYFFHSNALDNRNSVKQEEMMGIVLEWGRLAPFPINASSIAIETEGSSFTRSFRASFVAPAQDIQVWIKNSPGLKEATAEELSDTRVWYSIQPGGGANRAEVTIDFDLNKVEIYVSWS